MIIEHTHNYFTHGETDGQNFRYVFDRFAGYYWLGKKYPPLD
jgi:hypothetical protein